MLTTSSKIYCYRSRNTRSASSCSLKTIRLPFNVPHPLLIFYVESSIVICTFLFSVKLIKNKSTDSMEYRQGIANGRVSSVVLSVVFLKTKAFATSSKIAFSMHVKCIYTEHEWKGKKNCTFRGENRKSKYLAIFVHTLYTAKNCKTIRSTFIYRGSQSSCMNIYLSRISFVGSSYKVSRK